MLCFISNYLRFKHFVKGAGCFSVYTLQGVNVDIGCFDIGVTEAYRYGFDVTSISKKHRCARMAQAVEFEMSDIMSFKEFRELLGRSMRIHHISVFLGEDVSEILPSIAEEGGVAFLMFFILSQGIA